MKSTNITLTATAADTQYSLTLPSSVQGLKFRNISAGEIRYAFVTDKVASPSGNYETLGSFENRDLGELYLVNGTLYYASSTAGARFNLEIETE